ncbi:MAG: hypothetical protein ACI4RT_05330 [Candidatus Spyradenecus sp.]
MAVTHATWGVTSASPITGVVTDLSVSTEAQHQPEYNQLGAVIGDLVYDERKSASATIQVASTATLPTVGGNVTIDSVTYNVLAVTLIQSNRDFRKVQLTLEAWAGCSAMQKTAS